MPIDPNIALGVQPPPPIDPIRALAGYAQLGAQRENMLALKEQRVALTHQREVETAETERKQAEQASWRQALQGAYKPDGTIDQEALFKAVPPELMPLAQKTVVESQSLFEKFHQEQTQRKAALIKDMATRVRQLGDNPLIFGTALRAVKDAGALTDDEAATVLQRAAQGPHGIKGVIDGILTPEGPKLTEHDPTKDLVNPQGEVVIKGQPKEEHSPIYKEWQDAVSTGYKGGFEQYQNEDANRRKSITNINAGDSASNVREAVAGMKDGTIPPQLPGRASKEYTATMAEAHRQGYDLASAATDWAATQKHIATMNGAQQLRLNQAVNALPDMLDKVDTLAAEWKAGRFPVFNKAGIIAAKNGIYGKQAASIATRLEAQIADVTADLGNVYMGGNSPTDHALGLAAKSLSADWDERVLHDMVKLAKDNVTIRRNSIKNTGVAGASQNNPYGQQPAAADLIYDPATKQFKKPGAP